VEAWLQKVYGGEPVPQYEVNHRTLDILFELMRICEWQEKASDLVLKDWQLKAEEYGLEGYLFCHHIFLLWM
jgi:hypothetical protein